jgi:hypothetical protein
LALGDVTGDGFRDLAVGAPGAAGGGLSAAGQVLVFPGDGQGAFGTPLLLEAPTPEVGAAFGAALAIGDLTGDGRADLAIAAPLAEVGGLAGGGQVFLFPANGYGGFAAVTTLTAPTPQAGARFGSALALGDVTGDGRLDLLVGASLADVGGLADAGTVTLFPADGAGGFSTASTITAPAPEAGAHFGHALCVGDVSADGRADLIVGAPWADVSGVTDAGAVVVSFGDGAGGFANATLLSEATPEASAELGYSVALGEMTGDGYVDIVAGALLGDPDGVADAGEAHAFPGSGAGAFGVSLPLWAPTPEPGARFGEALAVGDLTGRGVADVVIGAPLGDAPSASQAGRVYTGQASP